MKRLTALILALMMLATMAVACAETPDETPDDPTADVQTTTPAPTPGTPDETTAGTSDPTTPAETTADPGFIADIPEGTDFGMREISILATGQPFSADEFAADSINGATVNDAVYARNMAVEDALNVRLKVTVASPSSVYNVGNEIRTAVATGDKSYDLATMPGYTHTSYVLEGDFYNLLDVDGLDLEKKYWTQGFNEIMNNGTRQYVASGAYSLSMYRNMYITLYNKDLFAANGLEDLYDIVLRDEWTYEKQGELARGVYNDLNGSTTRDGADLYGFVSGALTSVDPYWVSFNLPCLILQDDGEYKMGYDVEKMADIVARVQDTLFNNEGVYSVGSTSAEDGSDDTVIISHFNDSRAAMCTTMIFQIENFLTPNNFEDEYGIAPIPKYDKNQTEYYTHVQDQLSVIGMVSTVAENEREIVGTVMEKISEQSYENVYPAYYKNALSYRYLQNEESVVMLDLIYNSIKIEGAFIYSAQFALLGKLRSVVSGNANRVASVLKTYERTLGKGAEQLNIGLEKLKH